MSKSLTLNQRMQVCAFSGELLIRILKRILIETAITFDDLNTKLQVSYLIGYLEREDASTIVIESQYIDRHFLEDYANYHVRSFSDFGKLCTRLHFFDSSAVIIQDKEKDPKNFYRKDLINFLKGQTSKISINSLKESYLGFTIIRPLKDSFIGRTCLRTYKSEYKYDESSGTPTRLFNATKPSEVNLFGIKLTIENTLPFQEQDSAVAACATSALWSFFYGTKSSNRRQTPSPSHITKLAESKGTIAEQKLNGPHGLMPDLIRNAISAFDLEYFELSVFNQDQLLKELIYSYQCSKKEPVLLGVDVLEKVDGFYEYKGGHLIVVNGYNYDLKLYETPEESSFIADELYPFRNVAHSIDKLYCHDDQMGPFARFTFQDVNFSKIKHEYEINNREVELTMAILQPYVKNELHGSLNLAGNYIYIPRTLHLGVYHKIRRHYSSLVSATVNLNHLLQDRISSTLGIKITKDFSWSITLMDQNTYKDDLFKKITHGDLPYIETQNYELLVARLPRFIWRISCLKSNFTLFDILVDATQIEEVSSADFDISKGILHVAYGCKEWKQQIKEWKKSDKGTNLSASLGNKHYIKLWNAFIRNDNTEDILDDLYGDLAFPTEIYAWELDEERRMISPDHLIEITPLGNKINIIDISELDCNLSYNWIINEYGFLYIGSAKYREYENETCELGHPTLINGEQARIGGELKYKEKDKVWILSNMSGRYSIDKDNRTEGQLINVVELMRSKNFIDSASQIKISFNPNYG